MVQSIMRTATTRVAPEKADFRPALSSRLFAGGLPEDSMNEKPGEDDIVVPQIDQVRVYLNTTGDVVISRKLFDWERHSSDQEDDVFIVIPKLYVPRFVERVKSLLAEGN